MKMNDISSNTALREMWQLEVDELKEVLNGHVIPSIEENPEEGMSD